MKLLARVKAEVQKVREYHPIKVVWSALVTLTALGLVWCNFWLAHLLQVRWPVEHVWNVINTWWVVPFGITTTITIGLFMNSMSALLDTLKKEIR